MAGRRTKRIAIWASGLSIQCTQGTLTFKWLRSFWGHWVHFRFSQPCISKTAGRRAKRSEFWASGVSIQCVWELSTVKCLRPPRGHWGAFRIFKKLVSRKWLVAERNRVIFGPHWWVFSVYRVLVKLNASSNSGPFGVFPIFNNPWISLAGLRAKHTPKSVGYPFLCGHCLPSWHAERQSPCASC